jgi:hypothetical protein
MSETVKLSTLIPDMRNANLGTPRGSQMIEDSLRQYGAGRSILLACEKTGRKCYMMELSPQYCDVIVTRWEQATGKKAVLSAG